MEVLVAKSGGFCHGVKKAVDTALSVNPENTYVLGEIIHNDDVIELLKSRGLKTVDRVEDVPSGATLIIRSHGVPKSVYRDCERKNLKVIDCTCEFVRRTQKIVDEQSRLGKTIIIIGESNHPEVIGLNGWCEESAYVFSSETEDFIVLPLL